MIEWLLDIKWCHLVNGRLVISWELCNRVTRGPPDGCGSWRGLLLKLSLLWHFGVPSYFHLIPGITIWNNTIRNGRPSLARTHIWRHYAVFHSNALLTSWHTLMLYLVLSRNGEDSLDTFLSPDLDGDPDHLRGGPGHGDSPSCVKRKKNKSIGAIELWVTCTDRQTDANALPGAREIFSISHLYIFLINVRFPSISPFLNSHWHATTH